jgi:hypothetical protein
LSPLRLRHQSLGQHFTDAQSQSHPFLGLEGFEVGIIFLLLFVHGFFKGRGAIFRPIWLLWRFLLVSIQLGFFSWLYFWFLRFFIWFFWIGWIGLISSYCIIGRRLFRIDW